MENRRKTKRFNEILLLNEGDIVFIRNFSPKKLDPYYIGPMKVAKMEFNTAILCDSVADEIVNGNIHKKKLNSLLHMA